MGKTHLKRHRVQDFPPLGLQRRMRHSSRSDSNVGRDDGDTDMVSFTQIEGMCPFVGLLSRYCAVNIKKLKNILYRTIQ